MSKAVLLLSETADLSVTGPDVYVATLKRDKDALYTVSINVEEFRGRIYLQGSLAKHPSTADWFNIKINNKRYIDYPLNPVAPRGDVGDTAIDKFNFAGNFLHIRAVIDKSAVANPNGKVIQIVLSDEYSTELHNDTPEAIITPDAGQPAPGIGIQTFDFASVTVDSQGKIVSVKPGDPTKISAQTNVVADYPALLKLKPQIGDTALVDTSGGASRGFYIYTGTNWQRVGVNVSLIEQDTISDQIDQVNTIRFDIDSGFDLSDLGNGAVKVGMNSTFKYWKVDGQPDLVAKGLDTIKFIAGDGIKIYTNPSDPIKSIRFTTTSNLRQMVTVTPDNSTVLLGNFPNNANIKRIVIEVEQGFTNCELNILANGTKLVDGDEVSLSTGDISIFEIDELLTANTDCLVEVVNSGSITGKAIIKMDFALE